MRILIVCTGNLCRSPMAEAMLRHALSQQGCDDVDVLSAGTGALADRPATAEAVRALAGRGIDLSAHRSRRLDAAELAAADLVVAMTAEHVDEIVDLAPGAAAKVVMLKQLAELDVAASRAASPRARLRALLDGPRSPAAAELDIEDPIGLPAAGYDRCVSDLEAGVAALARLLCGGEGPAEPTDLRPPRGARS